MKQSGMAELAAKYGKAADDADAFLRGFLLEMGLRVLAKSKQRTPVQTGYLRNSWQLREITRSGNELEITLFNPVEYASYVEYGHKRKPWAKASKAITDRTPRKKTKRRKGKKAKKAARPAGMAGPMAGDWTEGFFMATTSIAEVQAQMPARLRAAFKKWIDQEEGG